MTVSSPNGMIAIPCAQFKFLVRGSRTWVQSRISVARQEVQFREGEATALNIFSTVVFAYFAVDGRMGSGLFLCGVLVVRFFSFIQS